MKKCEKCGTVNEADVSFCVNCGEKLLSATGAPKSHAHKATAPHSRSMHHQERPAVGGHLPADQKKGATQYCENCGTANEADVKFCVSCGNNLSGNSSLPNNQMNMNRSHQARPMTESYTNDEDIMQLQSTPNPVMVIWNNLLFPEKIIAVGAILNCLIAIFWIADSYLSLVMAIFYFATMAASFVLIHLSRGVTLLKKAELSRWQVAIGAFWLSWLLNIVFNSSGYFRGNSGLLVLNAIFSIAMLSGAIMLQGILLKHIFQQKNR